jgi:hypothetical protein
VLSTRGLCIAHDQRWSGLAEIGQAAVHLKQLHLESGHRQRVAKGLRPPLPQVATLRTLGWRDVSNLSANFVRKTYIAPAAFMTMSLIYLKH